MLLKIVSTAPATEMSEYNKNPAIASVSPFSKPFFVPREFLLKNKILELSLLLLV
jgi:hypothetical protein